MARLLRKSDGFGLIELTVVIIIVGILVAVAMQSATVIVQDARTVKTERELEMLAEAIVGDPSIMSNGRRADFGYVGDVGAFPSDLQALYENPGGWATWRGPYLPPGLAEDTAGFKTDEWGSTYSYSGGVTITSTGGGSTITRKIADAVSDYTLNTLNGTITDINDSVPGVIYMDSVDIEITIPDGGGGTTSKSCTPDAAGSFTLDSLPAGVHPVRAIYTPNVDTLMRYVTVLPRHKSPVGLKFASTYFGGGGGSGCDSAGTIVLRPTGAGTTTQLSNSGCTNNWECVDESAPDDGATYVSSISGSYETDTYAMADPPASSCTITQVTVYGRCQKTTLFITGYTKLVLRTGGTDYEGSSQAVGSSWTDYSETWVDNPSTGLPWTWSDITSLECGVSLLSTSPWFPTNCTQVWVEVEYTD